MHDHLTHAPFCDPRICGESSPGTLDHRSVPTTLVPVADDVVVHVGLSQLHEVGRTPAPVHVAVTVVHLALGTTVEFDLTPADARLISAALDVEAARASVATPRSPVMAGPPPNCGCVCDQCWTNRGHCGGGSCGG